MHTQQWDTVFLFIKPVFFQINCENKRINSYKNMIFGNLTVQTFPDQNELDI